MFKKRFVFGFIFICLITFNVLEAQEKLNSALKENIYLETEFSLQKNLKNNNKIVSFVPEATDIFLALNLEKFILATSETRAYLGKPYFIFHKENINKITNLKPNLIIVNNLTEAQLLANNNLKVVVWNNNLNSVLNNLNFIAKTYKKEKEALKLKQEFLENLNFYENKISKISSSKKVAFLKNDNNKLICVGEKYTQNAYLQKVGVLTTKEDLVANSKGCLNFKTDLLLASSEDKEFIEKKFKLKNVLYLPNIFNNFNLKSPEKIAFLASNIYGAEFFKTEKQIKENGTLGAVKNIKIPLNYVLKTQVIETWFYDFPHRTLLINLKTPMKVLSTYEGFKTVSVLGNNYTPPAMWSHYHQLSFASYEKELLKSLNLNAKEHTLLFTGADMNNLAVKQSEAQGQVVWVLATAGVSGNALRSSKDTGAYVELGTINIIILTNKKLTERAMARALITATEAKTAALWDIDIRSSQTPLFNPATGTGTDDIIVVQGEGAEIDLMGGHAKMGELLAKTVYEAVSEAILKQNFKTVQRSVLERLEERGLFLDKLVDEKLFKNTENYLEFKLNFKNLCLKETAFLEMALALSDAENMGLYSNNENFSFLARVKGQEIAKKDLALYYNKILLLENKPTIIHKALNALFVGLYYKDK